MLSIIKDGDFTNRQNRNGYEDTCVEAFVDGKSDKIVTVACSKSLNQG